MFLCDPSGNAPEFKSFADPAQILLLPGANGNVKRSVEC